MKTNLRMNAFSVGLMVVLSAISMPLLAESAEQRIADLENKTEDLVSELAALRSELEKAREVSRSTDVQALRTEVIETKQIAQRAEVAANERKNAAGVTHLAGYASADFVSPENGNSAFLTNFNPIFHFQYKDRVLWESELEISVDENGETDVGLEYSAIDIFLNDNFVLVAGKFLSPLGYFRQNIHPAWINKMASAPPGFGHDQAAPLAEVGAQLRGGMSLGAQSKITYAAFVGNGPKLEAEDGELHGVDTGGFAGDADDEKVFGGRFSLLPIPRLEIGFSGGFGDAAIVESDGMDLDDDPSRGYQSLGADISYQWNSFDFRGEYIDQDIDDQSGSVAPEGGKWTTWYTQAAYKLGQSKWEGVIRYTDFDSPHSDQIQKQWMAGVNYLLTPSAIIKMGYEFNDGESGERTDDDRFLLQIAYGY